MLDKLTIEFKKGKHEDQDIVYLDITADKKRERIYTCRPEIIDCYFPARTDMKDLSSIIPHC